MDWLDAVERYGLPLVALCVLVWGGYRMAVIAYRHRADWVSREHHEETVALYERQLDDAAEEMARLRSVTEQLLEAAGMVSSAAAIPATRSGDQEGRAL